MRYLSVCSGIEAATVAWHGLGWTPVGFSEIEPFPSAVLAHHYPNVPNFGDMTKHEQWPLQPGSIDLLVGGTPCQSFSVAGLRKGLHDPRGGLMLTYLEIARRLRPRWVVWENVPGVLSSNGGRDFGSFLGAMGLLGYGVAYRVLDAQWVRTHGHPRAVPQRRRRVFVVGCLGDWTRAAQVLFERESVQRNSATRRATGQGAAPDVEGGVGADIITSHRVAPCLETTSNDYSRADGFTMVAQPTVWPADCAGTLAQSASGTGSPGYSNQEIFSQNAANLIPQPIPFTKAKRAQSVTDDKTWVDGQVNPTLSLFDQGDTRATTVAVAFPIDTQNMTEGHSSGGLGYGQSGDPSFTVTKGHSHAVAFSSNMSEPDWQIDGSTPTIKVVSGLGIPSPPAVAFQQNQLGEVRCGNIAGTVNTNSNASGRNTPMAMQAMTVRRLTPRECERLQGFPDDYTLIPWRKKQAEDCPDGPRYKALGNSMAVNCMSWIGERIAALENKR